MMSRKAGALPSCRFKLTGAMPATRTVLAASCELSTMARTVSCIWCSALLKAASLYLPKVSSIKHSTFPAVS